MFLLCLIALRSKRKSDAGTYMVNTTSAPYFLHYGGVNAIVPVSMVNLNTSQARHLWRPSLALLATVTSKPPYHFSQHIPGGHGKEKVMRVRHSYQKIRDKGSLEGMVSWFRLG